MVVSEEIILERGRVECLVKDLTEMLKHEAYFQFKLRFTQRDNGDKVLTIIPHVQPIEIVLSHLHNRG